MTVQEHVSIASLTTFKVGGEARYVLECRTYEEIMESLAFIRKRGIPYMVIGEGSNLLPDDEAYEGAVIQITSDTTAYEQEIGSVVAIVSAGTRWDAFVSDAAERNLWGVENLAGIPGTVGAAPIQNIGAYGMDVSETILWVEALDARTGQVVRLTNDECEFGYRDSVFKRRPELILLRVAYRLTMDAAPKLGYKDLAMALEGGVRLDTPKRINEEVRRIRSKKFPDLREWGTAGSFFKNPILTQEQFKQLHDLYPAIPHFEEQNGVKIPLAWILDNVLQLRGFSIGPTRLFDAQPLVLVAAHGASARDIHALAEEVERHVFEATHIRIEREVRSITKNFL